MAYKLALTRTVRFVDVPTYRIHYTPGSASQTLEYREALPEVLGAVAALEMPPDVRAAIQRKISAAEHHLAEYHLQQGDWTRAMRHQLRSVASTGGFAYLPYFRKFLRPWRPGAGTTRS
jgi:hypothetical protein